MSKYYIEFVRAPSVTPIEISVSSYDEGVDFLKRPNKHLSSKVKYGDILSLVSTENKSGILSTKRHNFSVIAYKSRSMYFDGPPVAIADIVFSHGRAILYSEKDRSDIYNFGYSWHSYWSHQQPSLLLALDMMYICGASGISDSKKKLIALDILDMSFMFVKKEYQETIKNIINDYGAGSLSESNILLNAISRRTDDLHLMNAVYVARTIIMNKYSGEDLVNLLSSTINANIDFEENISENAIKFIRKKVKIEDILVAYAGK